MSTVACSVRKDGERVFIEYPFEMGAVMKGDRVEVVIEAGGTTRTYEVVAGRAGRRVEVVTRRGIVEVIEVTRTGTPVRTARFMASRVLALVEHPANDRRPLPGETRDDG